jgi:nucleotide-binding universal stress UspA family protein
VQADIEKASRDEVAKFVGKFPQARGPGRSGRPGGIPYEQIVQDAADRRVDLIVMAPRGKTGIKDISWAARRTVSSVMPLRCADRPRRE